jgi:dihydrofolate reductase
MRQIIAGINMTIDGVLDHTEGLADEEIHEHYRELLSDADAVLYGRITYELMKFWQPMVTKPSGEKSMDDFALAIDKIPKIVFSNTLSKQSPAALEWDSATYASKSLEETVLELKQQAGRDILVGSRSLIIQLMQLDLIDEYQLCIQPVVAGKGSPLFEKGIERTIFKLSKTKIFKSGAIILYYKKEKSSASS